MGVTALLMAGGRGVRLKVQCEKPLLEVCGKPMIQWVLESLRGARKVDDIIVAVSKHTPKTAEFVREQALKVFQSPGRGFCYDAKYAIKKLMLETVLTICADLPLITSEFIDKIIAHYEISKKPALTVMAPLETYRKYGLRAEYAFEINGRKLVPLGLNIVDGKRIKEKRLDEEIFIVDDAKFIVNVNTLMDKRIAELMLCTKFRDKYAF
jgi:adenosylcobinamide-phosphate guanylyltransferase